MLAPISAESQVADAPASGVRDAAMARVLDEPGVLVVAALLAGVSVARVVAAVAAVVIATKPGSRCVKMAEAAERIAEGTIWYGPDGKSAKPYSVGAWRCTPDQDDYHYVSRWRILCDGDAELATRNLCAAVDGRDVELAGGDLASDGADYLVDAIVCAKDVIGAKATFDAFVKLIPWSELAAAVAEVES